MNYVKSLSILVLLASFSQVSASGNSKLIKSLKEKANYCIESAKNKATSASNFVQEKQRPILIGTGITLAAVGLIWAGKKAYDWYNKPVSKHQDNINIVDVQNFSTIRKINQEDINLVESMKNNFMQSLSVGQVEFLLDSNLNGFEEATNNSIFLDTLSNEQSNELSMILEISKDQVKNK